MGEQFKHCCLVGSFCALIYAAVLTSAKSKKSGFRCLDGVANTELENIVVNNKISPLMKTWPFFLALLLILLNCSKIYFELDYHKNTGSWRLMVYPEITLLFAILSLVAIFVVFLRLKYSKIIESVAGILVIFGGVLPMFYYGNFGLEFLLIMGGGNLLIGALRK